MVKEELIHFHAHRLATMMKGLIGKVTIELVATVCMGLAEFLSNELQSWSNIHVVGEYHELRICPVYVKAVVYVGRIAPIEAISPVR